MTVICGQCDQKFENDNEYLAHVCPVYNDVPTSQKSMGKNYQKISEAALNRGAERVKLEKEGKSKEEAIKLTRDLSKGVM